MTERNGINHQRRPPDVEEALSSMLWTPYEPATTTDSSSEDDDEELLNQKLKKSQSNYEYRSVSSLAFTPFSHDASMTSSSSANVARYSLNFSSPYVPFSNQNHQNHHHHSHHQQYYYENNNNNNSHYSFSGSSSSSSSSNKNVTKLINHKNYESSKSNYRNSYPYYGHIPTLHKWWSSSNVLKEPPSYDSLFSNSSTLVTPISTSTIAKASTSSASVGLPTSMTNNLPDNSCNSMLTSQAEHQKGLTTIPSNASSFINTVNRIANPALNNSKSLVLTQATLANASTFASQTTKGETFPNEHLVHSFTDDYISAHNSSSETLPVPENDSEDHQRRQQTSQHVPTILDTNKIDKNNIKLLKETHLITDVNTTPIVQQYHTQQQQQQKPEEAQLHVSYGCDIAEGNYHEHFNQQTSNDNNQISQPNSSKINAATAMAMAIIDNCSQKTQKSSDTLKKNETKNENENDNINENDADFDAVAVAVADDENLKQQNLLKQTLRKTETKHIDQVSQLPYTNNNNEMAANVETNCQHVANITEETTALINRQPPPSTSLPPQPLKSVSTSEMFSNKAEVPKQSVVVDFECKAIGDISDNDNDVAIAVDVDDDDELIVECNFVDRAVQTVSANSPTFSLASSTEAFGLASVDDWSRVHIQANEKRNTYHFDEKSSYQYFPNENENDKENLNTNTNFLTPNKCLAELERLYAEFRASESLIERQLNAAYKEDTKSLSIPQTTKLTQKALPAIADTSTTTTTTATTNTMRLNVPATSIQIAANAATCHVANEAKINKHNSNSFRSTTTINPHNTNNNVSVLTTPTAAATNNNINNNNLNNNNNNSPYNTTIQVNNESNNLNNNTSDFSDTSVYNQSSNSNNIQIQTNNFNSSSGSSSSCNNLISNSNQLKNNINNNASFNTILNQNIINNNNGVSVVNCNYGNNIVSHQHPNSSSNNSSNNVLPINVNVINTNSDNHTVPAYQTQSQSQSQLQSNDQSINQTKNNTFSDSVNIINVNNHNNTNTTSSTSTRNGHPVRTFASTECQTDDITPLESISNGRHLSSSSVSSPSREHRRRERRDRRREPQVHLAGGPQRRLSERHSIGNPAGLIGHLHPGQYHGANGPTSVGTSTMPSGMLRPIMPDILHSHYPPPYSAISSPCQGPPPPPASMLGPPMPPPPPAHHPGGGPGPTLLTPVISTVPIPGATPMISDGRFTLPLPIIRRSPSERSGKGCCGQWFAGPPLRALIAVVAFGGVACVLGGAVLGATGLSGPPSSHFTAALLMIGVGVVLMTFSGAAWRMTAPGGSQTCLGLGSGVDLGRCGRRPCSRGGGAPHGLLYPEFQHRPPPPSYQASMQEYRLRLLLLDRDRQNGVVRGSSPPPTYRSHAGSLLRAPLTIRGGGSSIGGSEYSHPPSYRSRNATPAILSAERTIETAPSGRLLANEDIPEPSITDQLPDYSSVQLHLNSITSDSNSPSISSNNNNSHNHNPNNLNNHNNSNSSTSMRISTTSSASQPTNASLGGKAKHANGKKSKTNGKMTINQLLTSAIVENVANHQSEQQENLQNNSIFPSSTVTAISSSTIEAAAASNAAANETSTKTFTNSMSNLNDKFKESPTKLNANGNGSNGGNGSNSCQSNKELVTIVTISQSNDVITNANHNAPSSAEQIDILAHL